MANCMANHLNGRLHGKLNGRLHSVKSTRSTESVAQTEWFTGIALASRPQQLLITANCKHMS